MSLNTNTLNLNYAMFRKRKEEKKLCDLGNLFSRNSELGNGHKSAPYAPDVCHPTVINVHYLTVKSNLIAPQV